MNRKQLLDLYFLDARSRVIDVAAYLDRIERAAGDADFRHAALLGALEELSRPGADRAERVLRHLSDPTSQPIPVATTKAACGAWMAPGQQV